MGIFFSGLLHENFFQHSLRWKQIFYWFLPNPVKQGGIKRHLKHAVPYLNRIWFDNKLVLCFKHLLKEFLSVRGADIFPETIGEFFKYQPLAKNFLEEATEMFQELAVTPVSPNVTSWTAHKRP